MIKLLSQSFFFIVRILIFSVCCYYHHRLKVPHRNLEIYGCLAILNIHTIIAFYVIISDTIGKKINLSMSLERIIQYRRFEHIESLWLVWYPLKAIISNDVNSIWPSVDRSDPSVWANILTDGQPVFNLIKQFHYSDRHFVMINILNYQNLIANLLLFI
jgi:hypothetical protein